MDPEDYELILESYDANDLSSSTLQKDSIIIKVEAASETCQVPEFTFEKRSITIFYEISSENVQIKLQNVAKIPPNCVDKF